MRASGYFLESGASDKVLCAVPVRHFHPAKFSAKTVPRLYALRKLILGRTNRERIPMSVTYCDASQWASSGSWTESTAIVQPESVRCSTYVTPAYPIPVRQACTVAQHPQPALLSCSTS